jgi:lambda repressor-like predicted transcriptional regulator
MELNVEKIKREMRRMGWSYGDVAREAGIKSRQLVHYYLRTKSIAGAEPISRAFKMDPKDLIVSNHIAANKG